MISPPPPNFTEAGSVQWAKLSLSPPDFLRAAPRKQRGRKLLGIRYEDLVQKHFCSEFPLYSPAPWLRFRGSSGIKWCQPDGLLFNFAEGVITIVEIKMTHTSDSWWQMRKLYQPVLAAIYPQTLWQFRTLEVVRWYDFCTAYPEPTRLLGNPLDSHHLPLGMTGIHIYKPKKE